MQAFMNAFDYSGFEVIPKPKRICNYSGSLVGRDIKAFAQMALFILEPYLSAGEKEVISRNERSKGKLIRGLRITEYSRITSHRHVWGTLIPSTPDFSQHLPKGIVSTLHLP